MTAAASIAMPPCERSFSYLIETFDTFLFDAYGVLVNSAGALPSAVAAMQRLKDTGKEYFILTNDASKTVAQAVLKYSSLGFPVAERHIVSSGMLVADYLAEHNLTGAAALVLGDPACSSYVTDGGCEVLPFNVDARPDIVVLLDDSNEFPAQQNISVLITVLYRCLEGGVLPHLLLANPDLVYPGQNDTVCMAVGTIALLLEQMLALRLPGEAAPQFVKVGKPYLPIFQKALARSSGARAIMLGDQLVTDIAGAKLADIGSALLLSGLTTEKTMRSAPPALRPDFFLHNLAL